MIESVEQFAGTWHVKEISGASLVTVGDMFYITPLGTPEGKSQTKAVVSSPSASLPQSSVFQLEDGALSHLYNLEGTDYRMLISLYEEWDKDEAKVVWRCLYGTTIELDPRQVVVWGAEEDDPT